MLLDTHFWIKTAATTGTGDAYNTGVTNNGDDVGTITWTVDLDAPSTLYYICQNAQCHGVARSLLSMELQPT
jgi:hypothetical protein